MSALLLTKIGVLLYKEPSWKYTFPIFHAHPHDLHFVLVNFFTFVISLVYLSRYSSFFLTVCSLLALLLLLFFLSHTACLFHHLVSSSFIFLLWVLTSSCSVVLHLILLSPFFFFPPLLSLFITSVQSAYQPDLWFQPVLTEIVWDVQNDLDL